MSNPDLYRTYVTQTGFGLEAAANAAGAGVFDGSVWFVIGDAELDESINPQTLTDLNNQVRSYPATIEQDNDDPTIWIARVEIPADDGGFFIREAGIRVDDRDTGDLYCYARQAGDYKPELTEGQGKSYTIRLQFIPGNAEVINAKIDPSVQFATPTDLDNAIKAHEAKPDPHSQYLLSAELLRALAFTPVHNAGVGFTPNENYVATSVGQKCYVSEYETCWELIQTFTNVIDEATKAGDIETYAGYWGTGTDETGDYFTTPNLPVKMHIKSAGLYGNAGDTKEDHLQNSSGYFGIRGVSNGTQTFTDGNGTFSVGDDYSNGSATLEVGALGSNVDKRMTFDLSRTARTDTFTDTMGLFLEPFIWLPKGAF